MPDPTEPENVPGHGDSAAPPPGPATTPEQPAYWLASKELGVPALGATSPRTSPPVPTVAETGAAAPATAAPPTAAPAAGMPLASTETGAEPADQPRAGTFGGVPRAAGDGPARRSRSLAAARRLLTLLLLVLVAAALGYGLAFVSAELAARATSAGAGAATASPTEPPTPSATAGPATSRSPSPSLGPSASPSPSGLATPGAAAPGTSGAPGTGAATGSSTPSALATPLVHLVGPGETLTSIAAHYGVSVQALASANDIRDLNTIYVGQKLVIPAP